jgi:predicted kinase
MLCGKIAAGKSTLARRLTEAPATVLVSQDYWLSQLYPDELKSVADYIRYFGRLRAAMSPHLQSLLGAGVSIVLDFPANTVATRQWMRSLYTNAGAGHCLHFLDVPDEVCRARLHARNAAGLHEYAASDAEFDEITRRFQPPSPDEGFKTIVYRNADIFSDRGPLTRL